MTATVTLTTDFGTEDSYVAQVKGVLLSLGPKDLRLVDLSHSLPAQDVRTAALFVGGAVPRFPPGTVHLVVIDPGVGSARRALVARVGDQLLVGPDNGVLSLLYSQTSEIYALDPSAVGPGGLSATFHGRDLFAPAAARLAHGEQPQALGESIDDAIRLSLPAPKGSAESLTGEVIHIDRFGNLISNLDGTTVRALVRSRGSAATQIKAGEVHIGRLSRTYADVAPGELVALIGSGDQLEISVRNGSAQLALDAAVGTPITLEV